MSAATNSSPPLSWAYRHTSPFFFEESFDEEAFLQWMLKSWTLCFWYSLAYVICVFGLKYYMRDLKPFDLRAALAMWSAILGLFSIVGAIRTIPELVYVFHKFGFEETLCNPSYALGTTGFWVWAFVVSKVYELGDTMFIVLRKQPLIFLHWYHHIATLIYVWFSYIEHLAVGRWFVCMNYTVHAFMYSYYALRAMRIRVPRWVNVCITSLQITQMFMGLFVNSWAYGVKHRGDHCHVSTTNLHVSFLMYASYLVLFCSFFYKAYMKPKVLPAAEKKVS